MSQAGRNESGTDPFGPNRNEFLIDLRPYHTWAPGKRKADLVDELSRRLEGEPRVVLTTYDHFGAGGAPGTLEIDTPEGTRRIKPLRSLEEIVISRRSDQAAPARCSPSP